MKTENEILQQIDNIKDTLNFLNVDYLEDNIDLKEFYNQASDLAIAINVLQWVLNEEEQQ